MLNVLMWKPVNFLGGRIGCGDLENTQNGYVWKEILRRSHPVQLVFSYYEENEKILASGSKGIAL